MKFCCSWFSRLRSFFPWPPSVGLFHTFVPHLVSLHPAVFPPNLTA
jgi:hypothetical protein